MRRPPIAQLAMREAIDRALDAKLTATELRVFLALVSLVTLFDRTVDTVANRQIVDTTGLDPRHVRRALLSLNRKGVIIRTPGSGATASRVEFPLREGAGVAPPEGAEDAPGEGAESDPGRGRNRHARGGADAPASELLSEPSSEQQAGDRDPELWAEAMRQATERKAGGENIKSIPAVARCIYGDLLAEAVTVASATAHRRERQAVSLGRSWVGVVSREEFIEGLPPDFTDDQRAQALDAFDHQTRAMAS